MTQLSDECEIVISGISGRFPESSNMEEFKQNLLAGVNMISVNDSRFKPGLLGTPPGFGKLKEIDKFDSDVFGILPKLVEKMDPELRISLETTYEAICDAGINPIELRGSNTGVFVGLCTTESMNLLTTEVNRIDGLALLGCSNSMFPNHISYTFDFKGPSAAYDTACSTSAFALEAAVSAIRAGKCERAIVTASTLILTPSGSQHFSKMGMLSSDSACKSFDASGKGFARAESVVTILIQKSSIARRAFASIVHIKTNTDGYKENGITFPSSTSQEELLASVYKEAGVNPGEVSYLEVHGTGTLVGDSQELKAISNTFLPWRDQGSQLDGPLLIGSVKSNMGHSEGASGLCSIAKILIIMQTGIIPANLHFHKPHDEYEAIKNGRIKVVDKNMEWKGNYIGMNSFGFGGVNVHLLLKRTVYNKQFGVEKCINFPMLVTLSGRTEQGLSQALNAVNTTQNLNAALLLNQISKSSTNLFGHRGFLILNALSTNSLELKTAEPKTILETHYLASASYKCRTRPIWFVFNGIGSQWPGMASQLFKFPTFSSTIQKLSLVLKSKFSYDLISIFVLPSVETYKDVTNCFVGITATQIGLVDLLGSVGIVPNGFLGHSAGEMTCAYLNGLSAEETIITAYLRGESLKTADKNGEKASNQEEGAMAVVSLNWKQVNRLCPTGIYPACHNGEDSVTVAGSATLMPSFVQWLKEKKKGVVEVDSCGFAFHSPYIAYASKKFLDSLQAHLSSENSRVPFQRSSKWISSSIPESQWDTTTLTCSEYMVNNFSSPVLFYEALGHVPEEAIILEIGPSGLLRGLIRKTVPSNCTIIPLQSRNSTQCDLDLVTALGKIYLGGANFDVNGLLGPDEVNFPVCVDTPIISPLISYIWDHSTSWNVPCYGAAGELQLSITDIDMNHESSSYLTGHVIQGRILFPGSGYLMLVWKHFALIHQTSFEQLPIIFEDVRFNRVTVLGLRGRVEFRTVISDVSGHFEVKESGGVVASGFIRAMTKEDDSSVPNPELRLSDLQFTQIKAQQLNKLNDEKIKHFKSADIYKRFKMNGFEYKDVFHGILACDVDCYGYQIAWKNNWVSFLDTLLQTCIPLFDVLITNASTHLPTGITKLVLDPKLFLDTITNNNQDDANNNNNNNATGSNDVFVLSDKTIGLIKTHGIEVHWPTTKPINYRNHASAQSNPILATTSFTPYFDTQAQTSFDHDTSITLQSIAIVMENILPIPTNKLSIIELSSSSPAELESIDIVKFIRMDYSHFDLSYTIYTQKNAGEFPSSFQASNIAVTGYDAFQSSAGWFGRTFDLILLDNYLLLEFILHFLDKGSFLLLKVKNVINPAKGKIVATKEKILEIIGGAKFNLVAVKKSESATIYLIRKKLKIKNKMAPPLAIDLTSRNLNWISKLKSIVKVQPEKEDEAESSKNQLPNPEGNSTTAPSRVYLVTNDPSEYDSGLLGLIQCLHKESYYFYDVSIQFRAILNLSSAPLNLDFGNPDGALQQILAHDLVVNVIDENGVWGYYCTKSILNTKATRQIENGFVNIMKFGDFSTFQWIEGFNYKTLQPSMLEETGCLAINVHYTTLNFKDVMIATGKLPMPRPKGGIRSVGMASYHALESPLGFEFSGTTQKNGNRVFGFIQSQGIALQVLGNSKTLWEIPPHWSYEEAATVPVVYSTVYLALVIRGRIQHGESILIHSGAGGIGQAAIRVALSMNCEIYTTVGSVEKKAWIRQMFPQIPEDHIGSSRDTSFETLILQGTKGLGVSLILNSLAGDKLDASIRCLASQGRFLEIGKFDLLSNKALGMELFLKNASFHGVMLDSLAESHNYIMLASIKKLVDSGIKSGVVQPLPYRIFHKDQVEPAFRFMGSGKHIGKILIQIKEDTPEINGLMLPTPSTTAGLIDAIPRTYFHPAKSYVIIGGLGGIGLELINWMIQRGATKFVISSRSGITTAYQEEYIKLWERHGVQINVVPTDASKLENAEFLLGQALEMGPVDGIFNLAMHLHLGLLNEQSEATFLDALKPKLFITRNMDKLSRKLCPDLAHFVVFSSLIAGYGLQGQTNYGLANSGGERICEQRVKDGLPGKALEIGPILDTGSFHKMYSAQHDNNEIELRQYAGLGCQSIASFLHCLDYLLLNPCSNPIVTCKINRLDPKTQADQLSEQLSLSDRLSHIIGTNINKLNPHLKLIDLGLDSIMSMELKQILESDYSLSLSANQLRTITMQELITASANNDKSTNFNASSATTNNQVGMGPSRKSRAATSELFQFNFMKNIHKTEILYKQCVHALNQIEKINNNNNMGETVDGAGSCSPTVFICNSIEGPEILRILGSLVKYQTYSMQLPIQAQLDDMTELTNYYYNELKATQPYGPYIIVGYSFGIFIAIELALRLQNSNEIIKLVLMDLTPGRADAIFEENFGPDRGTLNETDIMIIVLSQVLNIDKSYLEMLFSGLPDKESKIQKAIEIGSALFDEPMDPIIFRHLLYDGQSALLNTFNKYKPSCKYHGPVTLLRTTQNLISYDSTPYWGLDEICTQIPTVKVIESTHSYLVAEPGVYEVAEAING